MCNDISNDYIFSIVVIDYKSQNSFDLNGLIHVKQSNENDLEVICSQFRRFIEVTFGTETC